LLSEAIKTIATLLRKKDRAKSEGPQACWLYKPTARRLSPLVPEEREDLGEKGGASLEDQERTGEFSKKQ